MRAGWWAARACGGRSRGRVVGASTGARVPPVSLGAVGAVVGVTPGRPDLAEETRAALGAQAEAPATSAGSRGARPGARRRGRVGVALGRRDRPAARRAGGVRRRPSRRSRTSRRPCCSRVACSTRTARCTPTRSHATRSSRSSAPSTPSSGVSSSSVRPRRARSWCTATRSRASGCRRRTWLRTGRSSPTPPGCCRPGRTPASSSPGASPCAACPRVTARDGAATSVPAPACSRGLGLDPDGAALGGVPRRRGGGQGRAGTGAPGLRPSRTPRQTSPRLWREKRLNCRKADDAHEVAEEQARLLARRHAVPRSM